ncbi:MAG: membrane protein [Lysobacteraceae bacterium]|nr:MAG: membrane protein [Xanthomonadaceae bacterium]
MNGTVHHLPLEIRFLRQLAKRLHEYGAAAYRIEGAIRAVSDKLRFDCDVFSNPTSILLSFRPAGSDEDDTLPSQMIRVAPGGIDLGKLRFVDEVSEKVSSGEMSIAQGYHLLKAAPYLLAQPKMLPQVLAWGGVACSVTAVLGAGLQSVIAAGVVGTVIAILDQTLGKKLRPYGSWEPIAAFTAAVMTALFASQFPVEASIVNLAAILIMVPGLGLTIGVNELTTEHLVSGTARLAGSVVVLLQLAFGVVIGTQLVGAFVSSMPLDSAITLVDWSFWPAILVSAFSFGVLFCVDRRDFPIAMLAAVISFVVSRYAEPYLFGSLNVFVAALIIAALSNGYARWQNRPAMIVRLPGIIALVPGSVGYNSLSLMFANDTLLGIEMTAKLLVILASLVGGLAIGNSLVPPRRYL